MKFSLCYKDYDYKLTWSAKREFKHETGRGLWPTLIGVFNIIRSGGELTTMQLMQEVGEYIDDVDAAFLLWVIAKQCNKALTLDEISDGVERVGWRPVDDSSEFAQPYTYILYSIMVDIDSMYEKEARKAKKDLCP